jgi:predicted transcriptional regulator
MVQKNMKLHEEVEEQAAKNARMKTQLALSKLQQQVDKQAEQLNELKKGMAALKQTVATLIQKLGPR